MKKLPRKKLNKNGFTLAELLIVVAIIAVLIAIALPLFFGALDRAEKAKTNANMRSARAAAINAIIGDPSTFRYAQNQDTEVTDTKADSWCVTAFISSEGELILGDIVPSFYAQDDLFKSKQEYYTAMKDWDSYKLYDRSEYDSDIDFFGGKKTIFGETYNDWSKYIDKYYKYQFYVFDTEIGVLDRNIGKDMSDFLTLKKLYGCFHRG